MYPKGKKNHPVVNVSWFAAKAYAEWCLDGLDVDDIYGRYHRIRGGSWFDGAEGIQITTKGRYPVDGTIATLGFRCVLPTTETRSPKVSTEIASFLYYEMRHQFDSARHSVSEVFTEDTNLDTKFAEIVTSNTGYPRTFGKKLIRIFREVSTEQMKQDVSSNDNFSQRPAINHDLILRLWRLYLEIHFEHSEKSVYEKFRLFRGSIAENINDIIVKDGR